jgi:hypothetical protein
METILQVLVSDPDRTNAVAAVANVLVAAIALLVAAFSIYLSFHTFRAQKTHNKLSVKPLPFIAVADYEDRLWVKLVNNGSGPLVVRSTEISGLNEKTTGLIERMPPMPNSLAWKSFTSGMVDRSILPTHELFFIDLSGDPSNPTYVSYRNKCRAKLACLTVSIEYTDIYGDKFEPVRRTLDWFARGQKKQETSAS